MNQWLEKNQWLYILFVLYQGKRLIYNKETPQTVENRFLLCLFWVFAKIKSEASINISPFSFIITAPVIIILELEKKSFLKCVFSPIQ